MLHLLLHIFSITAACALVARLWEFAYPVCKPIRLFFTAVLLWELSWITVPLFETIGIVYGLFRCFYKRRWAEGCTSSAAKFTHMAEVRDMGYNVSMGELLNDTMLQQDCSSRFGKRKETMSSVFGKAEQETRQSGFGDFFIRLLNLFQKNHSKISIDWNV